MIKKPTFLYERELMANGYRAIVGVDEAGSGALAGPVVAGACILPLNSALGRLHDSKLLTHHMRDSLYEKIVAKATAWGVGLCDEEEIMYMGIRPATMLAMQRALDAVKDYDYVLVDAWTIPGLKMRQRGVIKGDQKIKSIAAASVIAKVTRDRMMAEFHKEFPHYGFDHNKGYGTVVHKAAIENFGPCRIHRLNYRPFEEFMKRPAPIVRKS